jgi:hypothetical protein
LRALRLFAREPWISFQGGQPPSADTPPRGKPVTTRDVLSLETEQTAIRDAARERRARPRERRRATSMRLPDDLRELGISADDLSEAAAVFYDANLSDDEKKSRLEGLADRAGDDAQTREQCGGYLEALLMRRTARGNGD